MYQLLLVVHVLVAAAVIGLVLIQHGKGADIGASFGSGASSTVFGSQGTGSFLFRLTAGLAMAFFVSSVLLSSLVAHDFHKADSLPVPQQLHLPNSTIPVPVDAVKK
jgi:preprotein translocase subunit SecG